MTMGPVSDVRMGQCAVTGKMVPEDELVTIQGKCVCAEGKAILLERLRAGETMPGELERPTVLRRFGCSFLDGLILGVPSALIGAAVGFGAMAGGSGEVGVVVLVTAVLQTAYIAYFTLMHGSRGQSVGKIAGKLIVVNLDGSPITMGTAFTRALAYHGPGYLNAVALLLSAEAAGITNISVSGYLLANVLFALFDRGQQRALHDRIAGTRVVVKA
jgi:uncharacterized RDD family membrane protein YckC